MMTSDERIAWERIQEEAKYATLDATGDFTGHGNRMYLQGYVHAARWFAGPDLLYKIRTLARRYGF